MWPAGQLWGMEGMEKTNISLKKKKNILLGKAGGKICPLSPSFNLHNSERDPDTPEKRQPVQGRFRGAELGGGGLISKQINKKLSGGVKGLKTMK